MLRVLPVTADQARLRKARPEVRDTITHPTEPTATMPSTSPRTSASTNEDRPRWPAEGLTSGSRGIRQGYHQAGVLLLVSLRGILATPRHGENLSIQWQQVSGIRGQSPAEGLRVPHGH